MNLAPGFSSVTIAANMRRLIGAGYARAEARRWAMNAARKSFFILHPLQQLPDRIRAPQQGGRAADYTSQGAPILRGKNPVRDLAISEREMAEIRRGVQKQTAGKGAQVRKAAALYSEFTGHDDPHLQKIGVPDLPDAVLEVGLCDGILYTTIRDNVTEKYIHHFKKKSRPLLTSSPDGKQLFLLGGAFTFTDRGIVDDK